MVTCFKNTHNSELSTIKMDNKKIFLEEINILLSVFYWFIDVFHHAESMMNEFRETFKAQ